MNAIIGFIEDPDVEVYVGYIFASCLFLCFFLKTFINQYSFIDIFQISIDVINLTNISMMQKIIKLGTSSKKYFETGRIMNYITVDTQQIFVFMQFANILIFSPFVILIAIALIIYELKWIGILTPIFFFIGLIIQAATGK